MWLIMKRNNKRSMKISQNQKKTGCFKDNNQDTSFIPSKLKKKEDDTKFKKFLSKFSNLSVNIPLMEALMEMPSYASS